MSFSLKNKELEFVSREHLLFPTPFWQTQVRGVDNKPIKDYCYHLQKNTEGVIISNRGGWHSKEILEPLPIELHNLFDQTTKWVNNYCTQITGISDLMVGNFWFNINPPNTFNRRHDHQNSVLSGVYYVDCEGDNIGNFVIERDDNMEFFARSKYINCAPFTQNSFEITPLTGFLFLLPSWVYHSVELNKEKHDRISLAFNFVPKDPEGFYHMKKDE
tara:strand:- start:765 stop:1415 length:651 start_codon:yes stop_codon:yes gene_type:complete